MSDVQQAAARAARLQRHGLSRPAASPAEYLELFRRLQPVSPEANSYPGSAPRLMHRCAFDDAAAADELRAERRLVKGRFHGGTVGYVHADDLALYAAAYAQPLTRLDVRQEAVLRALTYAGPLSPRQLREETGLRHRPMMAAVHRLERAFVVCEDQTDAAWDRPLHLVEREWPELAAGMPAAETALEEVLVILTGAQAVATTEELIDGSGLGRRRVAATVQRLVAAGRLQPGPGSGQGWMVTGDDFADAAEMVTAVAPAVAPAVWVLHLRDPFVRPHLGALAARYPDREVLQYLLINDGIAGAVCGHWRIKPHDVDDVTVDADVASHLREVILEAVRLRYPPPERQVLAYDGDAL